MLGTASARSRFLGRTGLLLCVLAVVAVLVPGIGWAKAVSDDGVRLSGSPQHVTLPADRQYGLYVDDHDNSSSSGSCSVTDARHGSVRLADAGWNISYSDSEDLNSVFSTGSGDLTFSCSASGATLRVRPVPNDLAMVFGTVLGGVLGLAGVGLLVAWGLARRKPSPTPENVSS
jgi:hypothetical protein